MERLSQVLWRERELLETLHYRLEVEQLVLAGGRTTWLLRAAQDVEAVLDDLRRTGVLRAAAADEAAGLLGLPPHPSLADLVARAPQPWAEILRDHREQLLAVTREITALADVNRELVTTGYRSAREALLSVGQPGEELTEGYAADGRAVTHQAGSGHTGRVDRSL